VGEGILESPTAVAKMLRDAANGDAEAQVNLLIIAVTFRPSRVMATAGTIAGVVRMMSARAAAALRRLRATAKDVVAALRSKIRIKRGETTEYVGDKVRVGVNEDGQITDIRGAGEGPPTVARPPGSEPTPEPPAVGRGGPGAGPGGVGRGYAIPREDLR
jgi:hypothetical protein